MLVFALLLCATATAAPDGVSVREVEHEGDTYTVVSVDLRHATLDLYGQRPPFPRTFDALEQHLASEGRTLVVAMNGGIFEPGHDPTGLHIERGEQMSELNTRDGSGNFYMKPNGVFYVDDTGAHVVETSAWSPTGTVRLATQSGPLLLGGGDVHPAFRPESPNELPRNGVCASDLHTVHLAISHGSVRLHDFATLFRDALACTDALYLDGVISALRAPGWDQPDGGKFAAILAVTEPVE